MLDRLRGRLIKLSKSLSIGQSYLPLDQVYLLSLAVVYMYIYISFGVIQNVSVVLRLLSAVMFEQNGQKRKGARTAYYGLT